jgi:hypothetical protein
MKVDCIGTGWYLHLYSTYMRESFAEINFFATANFLVFFCFPMLKNYFAVGRVVVKAVKYKEF